MIPTLNILKNFSRSPIAHLCSFLLPVLISIFFAVASLHASETGTAAERAVPAGQKERDAAQYLVQGKKCLESGEYDKAITLLTTAYKKLPLLGDYALLWRAGAYEAEENYDGAIGDLRAIREKYKESPLAGKSRFKEIGLLTKKGDLSVSAGRLMEAATRENPSNMELKYTYAQYLLKINEGSRAKELLKEVFSSACSLSADAYSELSPSDITVDDLVKKGKALISAIRFGEAEKTFREALARTDCSLPEKTQITDDLAYSLFMQKKYTEAADLYKKTNNVFWRARSILRAGDADAFWSELPEFESSPDKRIAKVMISFGSMKRREGNSDEAIKIFDNALSLYPAAREDAMWAMGWTYYLSRDYKRASNLFSQLAETYGDSKYIYWDMRCREFLGEKDAPGRLTDKTDNPDFYVYMTCLRNKCRQTPNAGASQKAALSADVSERVDLLADLGLKDEAASELLMLSKKNPSPGELVSISSYLKKLGRYRASLAIISKVPYRQELNELYYPLAFWPEVAEASNVTSLDPYLILSVMREESRYEPRAQSVAGAVGLMQLMPGTAYKCNKNFKIRLKTEIGLYNARTNILLGSYYLKQLLSRFGSVPLALASYNGGEDAVKDWLKKGKYLTIDEFIEDIPYGETRNYVKKVMTSYFEYLSSNGSGKLSLAELHIGAL